MKYLTKKQTYTSATLIVAIILVSAVFHYSVHIVNALTLENAAEFSIRISVWRIVFEPFLGILLFFNRSFFALTELRIFLNWVLGIFIIYTFIKTLLIKEKPSKKKFMVQQLLNLPLVIGLWFVVFVIIIFIPLPNNTIVNNAENTILVNTHSHTEYSHDGLISQEGLWKWHKRNGFDAFFITDHNNHDFTYDFVQAQRNHKFPDEPLVMCGEEFSGSNHLSMLGLKAKFSTQRFADSTVINLTHAGRGAVLVNHWFDGEHQSLEYYKNLGVDGFEIENTATDKTYDRKVYQKIKDFCTANNLIMNGGVDFHGYGNVCSLWNAFEIQGWRNLNPGAKEEAILSVIKSRDQSKLGVLLYNDRPYYSAQNLFFSPLFNLFNYFRTLNFYQIFSWIVWILFFVFIKNKIAGRKHFKRQLTSRKLVSVFGIFGALFFLVLGWIYYFRIKEIVGFTEMYAEYSKLLFLIGSVFLIYSGGVTAFFIFKRKA